MMKIFKWVTKDTTIDFMGPRKWTYHYGCAVSCQHGDKRF